MGASTIQDSVSPKMASQPDAQLELENASISSLRNLLGGRRDELRQILSSPEVNGSKARYQDALIQEMLRVLRQFERVSIQEALVRESNRGQTTLAI